jgi:hypothetical protein
MLEAFNGGRVVLNLVGVILLFFLTVKTGSMMLCGVVMVVFND